MQNSMNRRPLSRRDFLQAVGVAGVTGLARVASGSGGHGSGRKMTMDLVCGNLGVKADLPTAIALAHDHGFESVAPDAGHLGRLSDGQLSELVVDLKSKGLTWGAAGLPVEFRGDDAAFRSGMAGLPAFASALKRAGATRVGTWISPGHGRLPYVANFRQHARRLREVGGCAGRSRAAAGAGVCRAEDGVDGLAVPVHPLARRDARADRRDRPRRRRAGAR